MQQNLRDEVAIYARDADRESVENRSIEEDASHFPRALVSFFRTSGTGRSFSLRLLCSGMGGPLVCAVLGIVDGGLASSLPFGPSEAVNRPGRTPIYGAPPLRTARVVHHSYCCGASHLGRCMSRTVSRGMVDAGWSWGQTESTWTENAYRAGRPTRFDSIVNRGMYAASHERIRRSRLNGT